MDKDLNGKWQGLMEYLECYDRAAIAFSGGVDSSFLLKAAVEALGKENVIAITANSEFIPEEELGQAKAITALLGIEHIIIELDVLGIEEIRRNPRNRCYICKKHIFKEIINIANNEGISAVFDGSNLDDEGDYRPGKQALIELEVLSPLKECGLTKLNIRELSKELGLPTWEKPSMACLASRIPYGEVVTKEKLYMIEAGEKYLRTLGFMQLRVRHHNGIARIEFAPAEMPKAFNVELMKSINDYFKQLGFSFVTMDLSGYRMGSLN